MKQYLMAFILILYVFSTGYAWADIDLVTLPERDKVQLTIYNSRDLTLVREVRTLTLKKGINCLSFEWANTLIDPTSLSLTALKDPDKVELLDVSYPPRVGAKAIWNIRSEVEGPVPVEITFFTSGISWRAFYMVTLSPDEKTMKLEGYVRVANNSGEEYENAQTRLIVGKVHILDEIANLARRIAPYGSPLERPQILYGAPRVQIEDMKKGYYRKASKMLAKDEATSTKTIIKEGLSEYFLYTIEGTETIPNGWSKRLPSFSQDGVPVLNLYKYEEEQYGNQVIRFLSFKNDKAHNLGETPLPDGMVKVYRTVDKDEHLSYEGGTDTKYIPVEQKAELNLGAAQKVQVKPVLMEIKYDNFMYDRKGNIGGYDKIETWEVVVKNQRPVSIKVEIKRNFSHQYWEINQEGDFGDYQKDDMDTVKYTLSLEPFSQKTFRYTIRYFEGERREKR